MNAIRVLVVEDSPTVRALLCRVLAADAGFELVGAAENGHQAIELCDRLRPDVITMDMMMPVMNGLAATEHVMAHRPTPILVVSSSTNRGELFRTYDALAAGAVDVLEKPTGREPGGEWEQRFTSSVRMVSRIRVITHPRARLASLGVTNARPHETIVDGRAVPLTTGGLSVVALGASTGGPGALVEVLRTLPPSFTVPIAFVLHIGEPFGTAFAEWLDERVGRPVMYATHGQSLSSVVGGVVMAPPDQHLSIRGGRLHLDRGPDRNSCRPSVDVLFESIAVEFGTRAAACLLTGMGRDGATGLAAVHAAGGTTIAQDEATSIVFGMPREAILLGAAQRILPLSDIGPTLAALLPTADKGRTV